MFGPFLKFIVDGSSESACTTTLGTSARSVVEVLMNSQKSLKLPSEITKKNKTKKDVLFNDVIKSLQEKRRAYTCTYKARMQIAVYRI